MTRAPRSHRRPRAPSLGAVVVSLAGLALAASCTTSPTEILVTIDSDASASTPVSVRVRVSRAQDASTAQATVWRFRSSASDPRLPASFAVVPEAGQREGAAWIYLDASFGTPDTRQYVIHRVASARFVANATVTLSIFLNAACGAADTGCASTSASACTVAARCEEQGLTCGDDGRCVRPTQPTDAGGTVDVVTDAVVADALIDAPRTDAAADQPRDAPRTDVTSEGPAPADVPIDRAAPPDVAPPDVVTCSGGLVACGPVCANVTSDRNHCGVCGRACNAGQSCVAGTCRCVPSCAERTCGDDGCGGTCGFCSAPLTCTAAGTCACPGGTTVCASTCCAGSQACIAGACRCVPSCAGRACGDDGCGGTCGACAAPLTCNIVLGTCACPAGTSRCGGACCASGEACVSGRCCPSTWRREIPGVVVEGTARNADGTLLLAGREGAPDLWVDGNRAYVATLDACGATVAVNTYIPPGVSRANLVSVATRTPSRTWTSPPIVVGFAANGTGDTDGLFSALSTTSLTPSNSVLLRASAVEDLFWQSTQTADGNVWVVGTTSGTPCASVVLGAATSSSYCIWNVFSDCTGGAGGHGITTGYDGFVWVSGTHGPNGYVARYPSLGCAPTPGCRCAPASAPVEFSVAGAISTAGRSVVAGTTSNFVAGYAFLSATDGEAFVASVTSDGRVSLSAPWNPTALGDGYLGAAYANTATGPVLYVSGVRGWNGVGNVANGTGVVAAYDAVTLGLRWSTTVSGAGGCWSVNVDEGGGVVLTCGGLTSSTVRRCLPTGSCP